MFYVYVLYSEQDQKLYVGYTENLKRRMVQHHEGQVPATKGRRPIKLIYFEGCLNQSDALKREKYLKTHYGRMFLKKRLSNWFKQDS
jgi:putative endonuclease